MVYTSFSCAQMVYTHISMWTKWSEHTFSCVKSLTSSQPIVSVMWLPKLLEKKDIKKEESSIIEQFTYTSLPQKTISFACIYLNTDLQSSMQWLLSRERILNWKNKWRAYNYYPWLRKTAYVFCRHNHLPQFSRPPSNA